jgi:hypothetical protein
MSRPATIPRGSGREVDRLPVRIACLEIGHLPFTLVSTSGFHCEVWQSLGWIVEGGQRVELDFVLKRYLRGADLPQVRVLNREYRTLRARLGEIVPETVYVATRIDGVESVVALCETCMPWFDLANPGNEDEALPLLERHRRALSDVVRCTRAARAWYEAGERMIDLFGTENLVLDRSYRARYVDSFHVFLYADVLHTLPETDPDLRNRVEVSLRRLEYLERVVEKLR